MEDAKIFNIRLLEIFFKEETLSLLIIESWPIHALKKWVIGPTTLIVRIFYKLLLVGVAILVVHATSQMSK